MNRIFYVEKTIYSLEHEKAVPSEEEIKTLGELLGQPTKKVEVLIDRYRMVFTRYIDKRCVEVDSKKLCLYTWNPRMPFKPFPAALHATGTIILFEDDEPKELLAYPMNKPLDYAKSPGVSPKEYGHVVPKEVTQRIDGWQLTAYYNPLLNRWIFATRYVLHNMYFEGGRLVVEPFDNIANPYVYVADKIAEELGLYKTLDRFRGWTFTFVLKGPEPAITKPPYPLGSDYMNYRLYLLFARDPTGKLYTWTESREILGFDIPPLIEAKPLDELYKEVVTRLDVRSYIAYIDTGDNENPLLVELASSLYPEAMYAKYLYDAKSVAVIAFEGYGEKLLPLLEEGIRERAARVVKLSQEIESLLSSIPTEMYDEVAKRILEILSKYREKPGISVKEIVKTLESGNIKRVAKKVVSLLLEGKSLATDITELDELIERIKSVITTRDVNKGSSA